MWMRSLEREILRRRIEETLKLALIASSSLLMLHLLWGMM